MIVIYKRIMYFLFLLTLTSGTNPLYTWVQETNFEGLLPTTRGGHSVSGLGKAFYVFAGCDVYMQCYNDLHAYHTDTHNWLRLNYTGDPPGPRGGHTATFLGTRLLIFGGSAKGIEFNDLYEYNAVTNH